MCVSEYRRLICRAEATEIIDVKAAYRLRFHATCTQFRQATLSVVNSAINKIIIVRCY